MIEVRQAVGYVAPRLGNESRILFATPVIEAVGRLYAAVSTSLSRDEELRQVVDPDSFTRLPTPIGVTEGQGIWIAGPEFVGRLESLRLLLRHRSSSDIDLPHRELDDGSWVSVGTRAEFVAFNENLGRVVMGLFWRLVETTASGGEVIPRLRDFYEGIALGDSLERQTNRAHFASALRETTGYVSIGRAAVARGLTNSEHEIDRRVQWEWKKHRELTARAAERDSSYALRSATLAHRNGLVDDRLVENRLVARTKEAVLDAISEGTSWTYPVSNDTASFPPADIVKLRIERLERGRSA